MVTLPIPSWSSFGNAVPPYSVLPGSLYHPLLLHMHVVLLMISLMHLFLLHINSLCIMSVVILVHVPLAYTIIPLHSHSSSLLGMCVPNIIFASSLNTNFLSQYAFFDSFFSLISAYGYDFRSSGGV
jgi:hypothetical protein